jgi:hypothetical protein
MPSSKPVEHPRKIQAESKFSQIEPNPAKPGQSRSKERLGFSLSESSLIKDLRGPPQGVFSFARLLRAHRPTRVEAPLRRGALLFLMPASFDCARSAALSFVGGIMAQILRICKKNVQKSPKRPEFRAF